MRIFYNSYFLSLLSGILLFAAWPINGLAIFAFVGFIPLFYSLEKSVKANKPLTFFFSTYLGILTWNLLTTWWVSYASVEGALLAFIANSLLMTIVFQIGFWYSKKTSAIRGIMFTSLLWISFEYLHLNWELTWPWLTLGNVFSESILWIQWYEYTGVFGGSIWILAINVFAFYLLKNRGKQSKRNWAILGMCLLFPIAISLVIYATYQSKGSNAKVQIIQPNIDPYHDKFGGMSVEEQINKMLKLSELESLSDVDLIVAPETALPYTIWEHEINENEQINYLKKFSANNNVPILTGASTNFFYETNNSPTFSARKLASEQGYYDSYNTALLIDKNKPVDVYHKSKLVPGVERIPFPGIFKYFEKYAIDLGGTTGSLGVQEERDVFKSSKAGIISAPIICYESVYGEFVGEYVNKGANLLCIITNDGWWDDTPGYKQHLSYAKLRAIETRRDIARSANTGMSAFINQKGEVTYKSSWWVETEKTQNVKLNNQLTFYSKHGDYLAIGSIISVIVMFGLLFKRNKI
jgi:apolipoprotein N-acyltransferase